MRPLGVVLVLAVAAGLSSSVRARAAGFEPVRERFPGIGQREVEPGRAGLRLPDPLWEHVLERVGFGPGSGRGTLGFTREELEPFARHSKYILPLLYRFFSDAREVPALTGRISGACLARAGRPDDLAALAWAMTHVDGRPGDAAAGDGGENALSADPSVSLAAMALDAEQRKRTAQAWACLAPCVRRLVGRLFLAAVRAEPLLRASVDVPFLERALGADPLSGRKEVRAALYDLAAAPWSERVRPGAGHPPDEAFELIGRFDRASMARGSVLFLRGAARAVALFRAERRRSLRRGRADPCAADFEAFGFRTRLGTVRIGSARNDWHVRPAWLVVDLAGDDAYAGVVASPLSLASPVGCVVDVSGDDRYVGGSLSRRWGPAAFRHPLARRPELVVQERPNPFGGASYLLAAPDAGTAELFLKSTEHWSLHVEDGVLWAYDLRDAKTAAALERGERPGGSFVRKRACRLGGALGSVSGKAADRFCWERRHFQFALDRSRRGAERLCVYREDSEGLALAEGCDRPASLASGFFGVGALFDLQGNDRYRARHSGLGEGLYGTGVLVDAAGDDEYVMLRSWGQGAGHVGAGVLADLDGDDTYECASLSQGFGGPLGCGLLVDVSGADRYRARLDGRRQGIYWNQSVSMVQGAGYGRRADRGDGRSMAGGFGVLADGAGDDLYESGAYGQGNAYWWAGGILEDRSGDDTYHMMQYGLGTAPHFGLGVCVDLEGDDAYNIGFFIMQRLLGHGRDGSMGLFLDGDGDDRYRFTSDCAGHADLNTIALFWDRRGSDTYLLVPTRGAFAGLGSAQPYEPFGTVRDRVPTAGIFLDTGGRDRYLTLDQDPLAKKKGSPNPGRNDSVWRDARGAGLQRFAIGLDGEVFRKKR